MITTLYLLQFGCLIFTFILALTLAVARIHIVRSYSKYEKSRWLLVSGLSLLFLHFLLQMVFNLRASGDDVGAMFNILFYVPVVFLVSYAVLNLECGREMLRRHLIVGIAGYVLILLTCLMGLFASKSLHIGVALHLMNGLFLACMLYFIFIPMREIRRTYRRIEGNTSGDIHSYLLHVRTGFYLLCISSLAIPFSIIYTPLLYIIAPLLFVVLHFFIVNFIVLGYNVPTLQTIQEDNEEPVTNNHDNPSSKGEAMPVERALTIEKRLGEWVAGKGFLDGDISLSSLSLTIGVSRRELSFYFEHQLRVTFRVWLSNIRFELAKKMMCEHPEYSNEAISAACGFSSRAQLYNIFRDKEGMTPKEYLAKQLAKD